MQVIIIWVDKIAPRLKKKVKEIIQKDLNFLGRTSIKWLVIIGIITPKEKPLIDLVISKIRGCCIIAKVEEIEIINKKK